MSEELIRIANNADFIVNGYAFTQNGENLSVLNLNQPDSAALMYRSGEVLVTSMDDIELVIVRGYLLKNLKYLEA